VDFSLTAEQVDYRDRARAAAEELVPGYQARERPGGSSRSSRSSWTVGALTWLNRRQIMKLVVSRQKLGRELAP
jgi:hypothetical protein